MNSNKFKCPVCGKFTLDEERMYEVCPVCGWEDDEIQFGAPNYWGGANTFSLNEYRKLFQQGLSAEEFLEREREFSKK